jgi:hypothetical protein
MYSNYYNRAISINSQNTPLLGNTQIEQNISQLQTKLTPYENQSNKEAERLIEMQKGRNN